MFVGDTGPKVFPAAPKFHRRIHSFDSTLNTTITISYRKFPRSLWSICGGFKCFAAIFHKHFPVGSITTVKECTCSYFQSLIDCLELYKRPNDIHSERLHAYHQKV